MSTRRSPATSTAWPSAVSALLDRVEITPALDDIWQRVRRLNRYVEEQAPWQLAKDPERAADLDACCARSPRACAWSPCCSPPTSRRGREAARRARRPGHQPRRRALRRGHDRRGQRSSAAVPQASDRQQPRERQPHAPRLVRAAQRRARRGGARARASAASSPSGWTRRSLPRGAGGRRGLPAGARRDRPPPQRRRPASTTPTSPSSRRSPRHPRCAAIGETGLDYYRDYAPRADQERAFDAQIGWRGRPASRWSSTRAPPRTTRSPRCARAPHGPAR